MSRSVSEKIFVRIVPSEKFPPFKDELTMALFEDADVDRRGALTFEALKAQLQKHEGLLENLSIRWVLLVKV